MLNNFQGGLNIRDRAMAALLLIVFGALIMIVFSPWRPLLEKTPAYLGRFGLIFLLLITGQILKRSERFQSQTRLVKGFNILALTVTLEFVFAVYAMRYLGLSDLMPKGWALQITHLRRPRCLYSPRRTLAFSLQSADRPSDLSPHPVRSPGERSIYPSRTLRSFLRYRDGHLAG